MIPIINNKVKVKVKVTLWLTVCQLVSLGIEPHLGLMTRYLLLFDNCGLVFVGRPLWREDESVFYIFCWPSPAWSFSGPSPLGLVTIFYCLRFETSLFVASYDSQRHGGGIRTRLHTGECIINNKFNTSLLIYCRVLPGNVTNNSWVLDFTFGLLEY
jgi:hypothetical protein